MFFKKNVILNLLHHSGVTYPVPVNITYWWNFGVLALFCLVIQILTGIFLAMHFVANAELAFLSVEHIMRDIQYGWLLRYMHSNGASMFFLVVYIHLFRGLYYSSYGAPRHLLWCTGVIILLIMILTAFMGYVLPWGQMSFWAATVITNLVSAIPYVGNDILIWLWGGFAVDNPTLNRFFSLHYLFPFVLLGLVGVHIVYLHENGSNNALGVIFNGDKIPFTPYFTIKDIYGIIIFLIVFSYFIFFDPVILGHPDNFIPANPLVTPNHIVPEWYFLPFYAILRAVPYKLFGFILLIAAILVLLVFPVISQSNIVSGYYRPVYQKFFWIFFFNCLILGWIGGKVVEEPFYTLGQISTIYYFSHFLIILPLLVFFEKRCYIHKCRRYTLSLMNYIVVLEPQTAREYKKWYKKNKLVNNICSANLTSLNKTFANKQNFNITAETLANITYNNSFFSKALVLTFMLAQGPILFTFGDRIPNITILLVMFIGYNILSRQDFFSNLKEMSYTLWTKIILNILYFINLNKFWLNFNFVVYFQTFCEFLYTTKNEKKNKYNYNIKKYYNTLIIILPLFLNINNNLTNFITLLLNKNTYLQYQFVLKSETEKTEISLF